MPCMKKNRKENRRKSLYLFILAAIWGWLIFIPQIHAQEAYPLIFEATEKAVLSAQRSGVLKHLKVDTGDSVKKGEIIAESDTGELALRKKRNIQALNYLNTQTQSIARLIKRGLATNKELEKAKMERNVTQTDLELVKQEIAKSRIYAPFNGVVVKRHVQRYEWVTEGQPVVEIVNPKSIRAVANIPTHLCAKMKKGTEHQFYVHDIDLTLSGKLTTIVPQVDERSNTAQVLWKVDSPPDGLLPGMKGEVRVSE